MATTTQIEEKPRIILPRASRTNEILAILLIALGLLLALCLVSAAFYPNDVIVRASDFKTNEYAGMIGGTAYEPTESNPMIGWRGASRYYDPKYKPAFLLECEAYKKVRDEMGLTNVVLMIPFSSAERFCAPVTFGSTFAQSCWAWPRRFRISSTL